MKITVYTVTDCQFSNQEKDYLKTNNLNYEEKNLELNKEWLAEMLAVSNNFAGTPVTKIEKDDGSIIVLKGFTKEEFDQALNLTPQPDQAQTSTETQASTVPQPPTNEQTPTNIQPEPTQLSPSQNQPNQTDSTTANEQLLSNQPSIPSVEVPPQDTQLNDVLKKLKENTNPPPTDQTQNNNQSSPLSNTNLPPIPDLNLN